MLETAERLTAEEREPALRLYLLLVGALRALAGPEAHDPSLVLDAFLLRACRSPATRRRWRTAPAAAAPARTARSRCRRAGRLRRLPAGRARPRRRPPRWR